MEGGGARTGSQGSGFTKGLLCPLQWLGTQSSSVKDKKKQKEDMTAPARWRRLSVDKRDRTGKGRDICRVQSGHDQQIEPGHVREGGELGMVAKRQKKKSNQNGWVM